MADVASPGVTDSVGLSILQSSHTFRIRQRLQGLVSSHFARLRLHAAHAAAALLPDATRLAVRIALIKDCLSFNASIGTVLYVLITGDIFRC